MKSPIVFYEISTDRDWAISNNMALSNRATSVKEKFECSARSQLMCRCDLPANRASMPNFMPTPSDACAIYDCDTSHMR